MIIYILVIVVIIGVIMIGYSDSTSLIKGKILLRENKHEIFSRSQKIIKRPDLSNDPIKTARYIWLMRQKPLENTLTYPLLGIKRASNSGITEV